MPRCARHQLQQPLGEQVVEVADQLGELARAARPGPAGCARSAGCLAQRAACRSVGGRAQRGCSTCLSDRRCSANRSRSDTMPTRRARARVTGTWRMPWRDISSAASCACAPCVRRVHRRAHDLRRSACPAAAAAGSRGPGCRAASGCPAARRASSSHQHRADAPRRASALRASPAACRAGRPAARCARQRAQRAPPATARPAPARPRPPAPRGARARGSACTRRFRKSANGGLAAASSCIAAAGSSRQKVSSLARVGGRDGAPPSTAPTGNRSPASYSKLPPASSARPWRAGDAALADAAAACVTGPPAGSSTVSPGAK